MAGTAGRVELGGAYETPKFVGLGKEELMQVAGTPFWVRVRWTLFIVFWLVWLGLVAGAVVLILNAPKNEDEFTSTTDFTSSTAEMVVDGIVNSMLH
ncbi:unnamed protein product [Allacma fusca]|uniref:Solute carrier family 3 member 2 N-terminal domain-containing protein n=1 Tax=Allacma fusca TaxID=39272 RepID=A0A8J2KDG3_9HEXA|nr:unnamed protein product [Allacma fusca]